MSPVAKIGLVTLVLSGGLNVLLLADMLRRSGAPSGQAQSSTPVGDPGSTTGRSVQVPQAPSPEAASAAGADDGVRDTRRNWTSLQTDNPRELAARLRAAGFSEVQVKGAVAALLDQQLAEKRRTLFGELADPEYWQPRVSSFYTPEIYARMRALERERQESLEQLFSMKAATDDTAVYAQSELRFLPENKIGLVARIEQDYSDLEIRYRPGSMNPQLPGDVETLETLTKAKAADLAEILTSDEMDLYELNRSPTASQLRFRFGLFEPTEQEFRDVYALQKVFDEQFASPTPAMGPDQLEARRNAEKDLGAQIKSVLGEERYAEYERGSDRGYQMATRIVEHFQLPPENAAAAFEVQKSAGDLANPLTFGSSLRSTTPEQRRAVLQEATEKLTTLLTPEGLDAYKQSPGGLWMRNLETMVRSSDAAAQRAREKAAAP